MAWLRPKLILLGLSGLVLVVLMGFFGFGYMRLTNIKKPLLATLQKYIDGRLEMESADLSIIPPGLKLQGVTLWAPEGTEPAAKIESARLKFNLLPLIQKKIESELVLKNPVIYLRSTKNGPSNMEAVFAPLLQEKQPDAVDLSDMWWRRIAVERLQIENAHFISFDPEGITGTELKNIHVNADHIRFESQRNPAKLKISYELPQYSELPLSLATRMRFNPESKVMDLEDGTVQWGKLKADLGGQVDMAGGKKKADLNLNLKLRGKALDLSELDTILKQAPGLKGKVDVLGEVTGSPFAPLFSFNLDSPQLKAQGYTLSSLHSLIQKDQKAIHLKETSFDIFGGQVEVSGQVTPTGDMPADLKIKLSNLSVAAATGKKGSPARLSGNLAMKSPALSQGKAYAGGGNITVGPIPLPQIDLKQKIRVAEVVAAGTGVNNMINVGLLGNSANVIGAQVDQVRAKVSIGGGNITLHSFNLGNGHFTANGTGKIFQQKSVMASGTFTLNSRVTSQFITDPMLRRVLTDGKNQLSFPFALTGPLSDPKVGIDSGPLKGKMAAATALMLQRQLMGGQLNPQGMLNQALKGTAAGDPKNPLGQFLGAAVGQPAQQQQAPRQQPHTGSRQGAQTETKSKAPTTGNSLADQLLFGR